MGCVVGRSTRSSVRCFRSCRFVHPLDQQAVEYGRRDWVPCFYQAYPVPRVDVERVLRLVQPEPAFSSSAGVPACRVAQPRGPARSARRVECLPLEALDDQFVGVDLRWAILVFVPSVRKPEGVRVCRDRVRPVFIAVLGPVSSAWCSREASIASPLVPVWRRRSRDPPAIPVVVLVLPVEERAWNHERATPESRKRIVRALLVEIVANVEGDRIRLRLHWHGGDHTELTVRKNRPGHHRWTADAETADLVRELARLMPDGSIAGLLNRVGKANRKGQFLDGGACALVQNVPRDRGLSRG